MISVAGNCLLLFSIATSILVIFTKPAMKAYVFWISSLAIISSFILLVLAFITSDFSIKNVFLNSSTIKPLIYKIAGSWASHEGSILLYVSMLSFISSLYIKLLNYKGNIQTYQVLILAFIQALFLFFVYLTSNPFESFKFVPEQGLGLNPLLQDKALAIHPPLLYMGYVSYITLYVNAILLLLRPKERKILIKDSLRLSGFSLIMLTLGIGLGAWWAYRELGWGGYWFFDPVENISLMPWIAGISLHHFLLVTNKSGLFFYCSVINSFVAFLLTLYGLFFVRSGIITSVHSFTFSSERGFYLFVICSILTFLAFFAFIIRKKDNHPHSKANFSVIVTTLDRVIIVGNILWAIALLCLFIAIIYPIYQYFYYKNNVAIDPEYFHRIFIPIFIPLLLIAALIPYLSSPTGVFQKLFHPLIALFITLVIYQHTPKPGIISTAIIFASTFLITQMTNLFLIESNYLQKSLTPRKLSLIIGHFSLGLLAFSISINVLFSKEIEFIGKTGHSFSDEFFLVKLHNIKFSNTEVYYRQIAEFSVQDKSGNVVAVLKPENRLYKIENSLSQESDIYSYLTYDMLASLSKIDDNTIHAIVYYKPMIWFIWLSIFLITTSFIIYIIKVK